MITDKDIARINQLYHKSKKEGLTPAEKEEQSRLRVDYIASIRKNLRANLDNMVIERPDGSLEQVKDRYKPKKKYNS